MSRKQPVPRRRGGQHQKTVPIESGGRPQRADLLPSAAYSNDIPLKVEGGHNQKYPSSTSSSSVLKVSPAILQTSAEGDLGEDYPGVGAISSNTCTRVSGEDVSAHCPRTAGSDIDTRFSREFRGFQSLGGNRFSSYGKSDAKPDDLSAPISNNLGSQFRICSGRVAAGKGGCSFTSNNMPFLSIAKDHLTCCNETLAGRTHYRFSPLFTVSLDQPRSENAATSAAYGDESGGPPPAYRYPRPFPSLLTYKP